MNTFFTIIINIKVLNLVFLFKKKNFDYFLFDYLHHNELQYFSYFSPINIKETYKEKARRLGLCFILKANTCMFATKNML